MCSGDGLAGTDHYMVAGRLDLDHYEMAGGRYSEATSLVIHFGGIEERGILGEDNPAARPNVVLRTGWTER